MSDYGAFNEIIEGYREAAEFLGVAEHLRTTIKFVTKREDKQHQCPSCQFSRPRHDVMERAAINSGLPVHERRCTFRHITGSPFCKHWKQLEVPEPEGETCGMDCGNSCAPDDWICPACREHLDSLSPRTKKANRPAGGTNHGWLRKRRANARY